MTTKKWGIIFIALTCIGLLILGLPTIIIDPFFHYHAPLEQLEYPLDASRQWYQNDGITRHFDYDAIITGSSMTENFKTSEFDRIFGVHSVKLPFSGEYFKFINENLQRAFDRNPDISCVIRGLDYDRLARSKDRMGYASYPTYLYNDFLPDDVSYFLNKEILCTGTGNVIKYTRSGFSTRNFDEYSSWEKPTGKEAVLSLYERPEKTEEMDCLSDGEYTMLEENISQNILSLALANPQTDFYLFWTPYSIVYWDRLKQENRMEKQFEIDRCAAKLLMGYDNIHLYSFFDEFDLICDLDNYIDPGHYESRINSMILQDMYNGNHELTEENYDAYYDKIYDFYTQYDYDAIFIE